MDNKVRFILAVVNGEIIINNRKRADLFLELHQKGFTPFPKKTKGIDAAIAGTTVDAEENEDSPEMVKGGVKASDYGYLLSMSVGTLTLEKVQGICAERDKLKNELHRLRFTPAKSLWRIDLDAFKKQLDEQDAKDAEEEKGKKEIRAKNIAGAGVTTGRAKKPRNNANKNSTARAPAAGNNPEVGKPKPIGGETKAAANKTIVLESDDNEDDELLELIMKMLTKDRLAACNLDSSSDQPAPGSVGQQSPDLDLYAELAPGQE